MKAGQTFRVIAEEGPQIGDVTLWNAHDPTEFFSATHTWELEGWPIGVYSRLWSAMPGLRPMATCVEDIVVPQPPSAGYHNHYVRTHCTTEWRELLTGVPGLNSCHLNFLQAIEPFGLKEEHIHSNFMAHEKSRLDSKTGKKHNLRGDARPGDYIEFYAEMDLLVAVSVCPYGECGPHSGSAMEGVTRPLAIEVCDTGIPPQTFPQRVDWRRNRSARSMPPLAPGFWASLVPYGSQRLVR